jgi:uncharacterized protein YcfL
MRKYLITAFLVLLLVGCGSATESSQTNDEVPAAAENSSGSTPTAVTANNESAPIVNTSVTTGSTPEEASIIREQDHVIGAEEPVVSIIEYGDFQ